MKIQTKLVLLMLAVMVLFVGGILALRQATVGRAELLLAEKQREKAAYFNRIVKLQGVSLETLAYDYTSWDEMVRFAETGDSAWAASQLDGTVLQNYHADALWVYGADGRLVYAIDRWGRPELERLPVPAGPASRLFAKRPFRHFFARTPLGFLEVRGATIHPSEDKARATPRRGFFYVGRVWGEEYRKELETLTESSIAIGPAGAAAPQAQAGEEMAVRFVRAFPGPDGAAGMRVDVASDSGTIRDLTQSARRQVLLLVLFAAVLTVVLFVSLIRWVSLPLKMISRSLSQDDPAAIESLLRDRAEFGQLARVVGRFFQQREELVREIQERERAEEQLRHDAFHDALTGLANRSLFMDRLTHAMARAARRPAPCFAVLFLDLDRFKVVNDSLGHMSGDRLLDVAARRLLSCVRAGDLVARLGGDEFAILLEGVGDEAMPIAIAERIQAELGNSFDLGGHEVYTSASIGIALSSPAYERPEDLLRDADRAMYEAKALGKARHVVYHDALGRQAVELLELETSLRRGFERGELEVHYQPIVALDGGGVVGVEALVRWRHAERGLVAAADFVPMAEECGLVVALDRWVLSQACAHMREWDAKLAARGGRLPLLLAVNVSSKQFAQAGLVAHVEETLRETGLHPSRLRLEITESALVENAESAASTLTRLKALGVGVCLDDFGTGYSSLSYLRRFPVDALKVDRTFVARIAEGENLEIVRTIVMLARNLGLAVVGEGVETAEQVARLRALGCDHAQGYHFASPLEPDALASWLLEGDLQPAAAAGR